MLAYRLEHKRSKLGPFEHRVFLPNGFKRGDQLKEVIHLGFHKDPENMVDLKSLKQFRCAGWVFGWTNKRKFNKFCPPSVLTLFKKHGFQVVVYELGTDFHKFPDGQVMFSR